MMRRAARLCTARLCIARLCIARLCTARSGAVRSGALLGLLLLGSGQAAGIKLRPQGDALTKVVQAAIAQLSSKDIPMTLDSSGGPTMTLGGVGLSGAPFNPDQISRVVLVGAERRIELNPQGPVPLAEAVRQTLMAELNLKEWTPLAAQQRFGGADLNGDGAINLADLAILMANYGVANPSAGDLNQDRKVDDADLRLFSAQYSAALTQPPKPAPAPADPATVTPPPAAPSTATPTPTTPVTPLPASPTAPNNPAPAPPSETPPETPAPGTPPADSGGTPAPTPPPATKP